MVFEKAKMEAIFLNFQVYISADWFEFHEKAVSDKNQKKLVPLLLAVLSFFPQMPAAIPNRINSLSLYICIFFLNPHILPKKEVSDLDRYSNNNSQNCSDSTDSTNSTNNSVQNKKNQSSQDKKNQSSQDKKSQSAQNKKSDSNSQDCTGRNYQN